LIQFVRSDFIIVIVVPIVCGDAVGCLHCSLESVINAFAIVSVDTFLKHAI